MTANNIYRRPKVFIGSSVEGLVYAEALTKALEYADLDIVPWPIHFDKGNRSPFSQIMEVHNYDFAIIIFTPDDTSRIRKNEYITPRDNLVFELGIFLGILGKERVFPIVPNDPELKLPSDLIGITPFTFDYTERPISLKERLSAINITSIDIKDRIKHYGIRNSAQFYDHFLLATDGDKIKFRIGYIGPGSLLNVKFSAHLISVKRAKNEDDNYYKDWESLNLTTKFVPELTRSWGFSHILDSNSQITKLIGTKGPYKKEDFQELAKYRMRIDINGFNSQTSMPAFAKKNYNLADIKVGDFVRFYKTNSEGYTIPESIDWSKFNKIKE